MTAYRAYRDDRIAQLERDAKINEALIERLKAEKRKQRWRNGWAWAAFLLGILITHFVTWHWLGWFK